MKISIEWLSDSNDCDTCGGGYATGAKVWFDDKLVISNVPVATCFFDGADWSGDDIYKEIITKLGHNIVEILES